MVKSRGMLADGFDVPPPAQEITILEQLMPDRRNRAAVPPDRALL
jgi:hypothetical protein